MKSFKSNFLHSEVNFNIDVLTSSYKGTKLIPKQQITDLLNQAIDKHNELFLDTTNWDSNTEGQIPARIPKSMNKPQYNIMQLRERGLKT